MILLCSMFWSAFNGANTAPPPAVDSFIYLQIEFDKYHVKDMNCIISKTIQSNKGYLFAMTVILIHFKLATDYKIKKYDSVEDIFISLQNMSLVCSTYFDKDRLPTEKCPICLNRKMSSFPILPNESFTFNYNDKRGVELEFRPRKKNKEQQ